MLAAVLEEAKKLVIPTKKEQKRIASIVKDVDQKVSAEIRKRKIAARIVVGGSVAKGTWLPGISDIDFFLIFNYETFVNRSAEISDIAESILKKVFPKLQRLHGSRDYFATKYKRYNIEFVPVLDISQGQQAKNITDFSPLHINWVVQNVKRKDDARLAKQFMKAAKVYGAESYIAGFSGHVVDILIANYGSFEKLLRSAVKWEPKEFIDPAKHYANKAAALAKIDKSKLFGPLILVDPVEPERNAAAALGFDKFNSFKTAAKKFLANPSIEFFKEKAVSLNELTRFARGKVLIVFELKTPTGKPDIIGAKIKNLFEMLQRRFADEDFIITESGWEFGKTTKFWFYFDKKPLQKIKLHFGPPTSLSKEHIVRFKKAWPGHKVFIINNRFVIKLKRKFTKPQELARMLAKEFKLRLIYCK